MRCVCPIHYCLQQGSKGEDRLTVSVRPGGSGDFLAGVFDGHRSHDVAGHAARILPDLVWCSLHWPSSPGDALSSAMYDCHESARREELRGGSTAVVVASTGATIWCCSAGDSGAVAGLRSGGVQRLSAVHTAASSDEVARIRAGGGNLEWGRVGGMLPMTRGLGNFCFEADGFACLPQVSSVPRDDVDFVIVASDGLWDVMTDQECCDLVRDFGGGDRANNRVAEHLAAQARSRWEAHSSIDDIAVIVAFFAPQAMDITSPMTHTPTLFPIPSSDSLVPSSDVFFGAGGFGLGGFGPDGGIQNLLSRPPPVVRELPFNVAIDAAAEVL